VAVAAVLVAAPALVLQAVAVRLLAVAAVLPALVSEVPAPEVQLPVALALERPAVLQWELVPRALAALPLRVAPAGELPAQVGHQARLPGLVERRPTELRAP
jgi:hypothetical protein